MIQPEIYLDYNSTTPTDARVVEAMLPYFTTWFGNASSKTHKFGWEAEAAITIAREKVSALIGAQSSEIIFTSGATESINIALQGLAQTYSSKKEIITCSTEHKAVLDSCEHLSQNGYHISFLPVDREGNINLSHLESLLNSNTLCVCLMMVNNETGVIHPIDKIGALCKEKKVFFVTDASQAAGKMRIDVNEMKIDVLCFSAHKMYGPKGVGALFVRRRNPAVKLQPLFYGGGHENGLRPGTLNVPGIVGFGKACELSSENIWEESGLLSALRTTLEQLLEESLKITINGNMKSRISNTTNISFQSIEAIRLIRELPNLAFSTGSACTSALPSPSHVLKSMGLTDAAIFSSVRFSLGRFTTLEEIKIASDHIIIAVNKLLTS